MSRNILQSRRDGKAPFGYIGENTTAYELLLAASSVTSFLREAGMRMSVDSDHPLELGDAEADGLAYILGALGETILTAAEMIEE